MKFEEIIPALKEGKKARRKRWGVKKHNYIVVGKEDDLIVDMVYGKFPFTLGDLIADDWEIVKEKKKVKLRDLTEEQYNKWIKNNCTTYGDYCDGCPFQKVRCNNRKGLNDAWYLNKDLYSNKFLDQEIEIEEE